MVALGPLIPPGCERRGKEREGERRKKVIEKKVTSTYQGIEMFHVVSQ